MANLLFKPARQHLFFRNGHLLQFKALIGVATTEKLWLQLLAKMSINCRCVQLLREVLFLKKYSAGYSSTIFRNTDKKTSKVNLGRCQKFIKFVDRMYWSFLKGFIFLSLTIIVQNNWLKPSIGFSQYTFFCTVDERDFL